MKKFYILASALLAVTTLKAQFTTVDFEELTLPAVDTFYTGEDETGQFTSNDVIFKNNYETTQWGYSWSGFAYSNMTDNQTAGYDNQYSSYAGYGADNSDNYAVYYTGDTLVMPGIGADFGNVSITNTTYAGISMRDGDLFAKQFGSTTDANGDPDGTNGEDFFYVTVYGWDQQDELVDSTEIYLADYRFANNTQDYILKSWTQFNWSTLNGSKYLTFSFTSSDVGDFGINTPRYFAMDNLEYKESNVSLTENKINISVYPNPAVNTINIENGTGTIKLADLNGRVVLTKQHLNNSAIDVSELTKGIYLIHLQNDKHVTTKKIVVN